MKISGEPPTKVLFFVGNSQSEGRNSNFQARLKFSSEAENFKRDCLFFKIRDGAKFAVFFRRFSQIFADFRFSWELQYFGGRDFCRKPQMFAETGLSYLVCPF